MNFLVKKSGLRFNGKEYRPGDIVPGGVIAGSRVAMLNANGYIVKTGDEAQPKPQEKPVKAENKAAEAEPIKTPKKAKRNEASGNNEATE